MTQQPNPHMDDVLDRATAALKDLRVPDGPPPALLDETIARLQSASYPGGPAAHFRRLFAMKPIRNLATAAAVALIILGTILFTHGPWGGRMTYADVVEQIQKARAVGFKSTTTTPMNPNQAISADVLLVDERYLRQSMPNGMTEIIDFQQGKAMMLDPNRKQAILMNMNGLPANGVAEMLKTIKTVDDKSAQRVGEEQVDGRNAMHFQVMKDQQRMDLWADTQTKLPVKVELNIAAPNYGTMRLTMTGFSWNAQPPGQISLTPPDGYTVVNMNFNFTLPNEQEFTAALGQWAQLNGGRFPDSIEPTEVNKLMSLRDQPGHTDAEIGQAMMTIARGLLFKSPTNGSDWHYVGKGVALGQGDTPILWYHPVNSQTWRIIDASLKARTAGPQDLLTELPQAPKR